MTEDQGWRKEQLPNGAFAYIIQRKYDPERPLLVHFGLRECQLVICGLCMGARLFKTDYILRDVALWCKKHWESFQSSNHVLPPHDTTQCYSEGVLIDILAESVNATNKRQTVGLQFTYGPRSILLTELFLINTFGGTRVKELKGNQPHKHLVKVCNKCLREANDTWCCGGSRLILVFRLQAAKRMEPLLCTNDAANLAHDAAMLASVAELATQANQLSTSPSPLTCPRPQISLSYSLSTNAECPLYRSVAEVLIGYDGGKLDARSTMEQVRKIVILGASRLVESNGDAPRSSSTKRYKQVRERDDAELKLLLLFGFNTGKPSLETMGTLAKAHTFDRNACDDVLLMGVAGCLLDRLLDGIVALKDPILLIHASKLPSITGYVPDDHMTNERDPWDESIDPLNAFDPATYKQRKRAVFSLLKLLQVLPEVEGHHEIKLAYQRIEGLCDKRKLERSFFTLLQALESLWEDKESEEGNTLFKSVGLMIAVLESCIRRDMPRCSVILQVFLFGHEGEHIPRMNDGDGADDTARAEAELESDGDGDATPTAKEVPIGIRPLQDVCRDLEDVLSVFKYTSLYPLAVEQRKRNAEVRRLEELRGLHMDNSPEAMDIVEKRQRQRPLLRMFYDDYEKTTFTACIARLIADLNRMQKM